MNSTYVDQDLVCRDCDQSFVFTAGEREFFASRGFEHPPSRCPSCRAVHRARQSGSEGHSGSGYPHQDRGPRLASRELHPAVCSACGKECLVPFLPRGDKPVYCDECFARVRSQRR